MTGASGAVSPYDCWLGYRPAGSELPSAELDRLRAVCSRVAVSGGGSAVAATALDELVTGVQAMLGVRPAVIPCPAQPGAGGGDAVPGPPPHVLIAGPSGAAAPAVTNPGRPAGDGEDGPGAAGNGPTSATDGFTITAEPGRIVIAGHSEAGCLHGVFAFLRRLQTGRLAAADLRETSVPRCALRIINHWDNIDGTVERGYAGASIFFSGGAVTGEQDRVRDYARLLASVGINAISVNNVNVTRHAARLITAEHLPALARLAGVLRGYGVRMLLSVSFASPVILGGLPGADPLDEQVAAWWRRQAAEVYRWIPDLGGFVVKADSEGQPGPHGYGRTQADGANVIAAALRPFGGTLIWRAFVYNWKQDWRDRATDRARAAHEVFMPLDGKFAGNVILQVKNGPMDFQVREPPSPLLMALRATAAAVELQITQEYTGQQRDLCFLAPQWHEVLSVLFAERRRYCAEPRRYAAVAGVANVGDDPAWTGHPLAQANLYAFGRLAWDRMASPETVAAEWAELTFGRSGPVAGTVTRMLLASWRIYENYTAPLGVGWMVTPGSHYGPSIDGYEYSRWGTYHFADRDGIGVDRTVRTGSSFTVQYPPPLAGTYEDVRRCPDELLLFFHHVAYTQRLRSGKTVIQHIYDAHFDGAAGVDWLIEAWSSLEGLVHPVAFENVRARLELQRANAREWRDVVNSYFLRKSGIPDEHGRPIY